MLTLDQAVLNNPYRIVAIQSSQSWTGASDLARQLLELGFIKGEEVVLLHRTQPGSDPLVVRVGLSTYGLRKQEAAAIEIESLHA
jgi:ferrous iron transport protein A